METCVIISLSLAPFLLMLNDNSCSVLFLVDHVLHIYIYMEKYNIFHPQGKAQRRINAVHVMDVLILNGTDVRDKHFNQRYDSVTCFIVCHNFFLLLINTCCMSRIQMAEKFVKAVAKPSRPDMNPIRY